MTIFLCLKIRFFVSDVPSVKELYNDAREAYFTFCQLKIVQKL